MKVLFSKCFCFISYLWRNLYSLFIACVSQSQLKLFKKIVVISNFNEVPALHRNIKSPQVYNLVTYDDPTNTKHLYNMCITSAQRLRRWSNIVHMLYKCFVFTDNVMLC